jgi:hypothetical protein
MKGYWRRPSVWKFWRRQYLDPALRERDAFPNAGRALNKSSFQEDGGKIKDAI